MFDLFRSRAKAVRILLGGLLLLVALSMVTYLIPGIGYNTGADSLVVAEFGKEVLTLPQVQQVVQAELRGQNIPPQMASILVPQLVNQLITEYAVAYQAEQMGFRVTEQDLARVIRTIFPQLFDGDRFVGREAYAALVAQQNMTIPQFENTLRKQLLVDMLRRMVQESVAVSPQDIVREFHYRNDKIKIEYAVVSPVKYQSEVKVSPEEIQNYFNANRSAFRIGEKRSLDVLVVDQDKLAQSLVIPDEELRRIYEKNKDAYRVPERVHVRHILLKTTDVPADRVPAIEAKAQSLLKQLRSGADFATLAKKNSEDTASAEKGGDLSWIVRGQTVQAFENAAFSLKPGEISEVIKTEYGFHILQVLERQQAHVQSFQEVKDRIAEEQKAQLLFDRMQTLSDQARAALQKEPAAGARIAADLGLSLIRAEKVGPGDALPGLGASPEIMEAAAGLRKGEVTPVVQIAPTRLAVAVVTEVIPARDAELAEVQDQIRQLLMREKTRALVAQRASELYERAKAAGGDLRKAAQGMGLEVKTSNEFARDGSIEGVGGAGYFAEAFNAQPGQLFSPAAVNDMQVVYKLVAKIAADESELAAQRESLLQQLRNNRARARVEVFEDSVRQRLIQEGKVKVNQDVINRLVASYRGT